MSLTSERRLLSDTERARALELVEQERPKVVSIVLTSVFLIGAAAVLAPFLAGSMLMLLDGMGVRVDVETTLRIFGTAAVIVLAWEGWSIYATVAEKSRVAAAIEGDLAGGVVEVLHVETTSVERAPMVLSEEPAFLHDLGDGTALFTHGAHLAPLVAKKTFPCARFSLVRLPVARRTIAVLPEGDALVPVARRRALDGLGDGEIVKRSALP